MDTETELKPADRIAQVASELGLTMTTEFVPFSKSRNAKDKNKSLNWRIAILKKGSIDVLTTDYMQGVGHCPGELWTFTNPHKTHDGKWCAQGRKR